MKNIQICPICGKKIEIIDDYYYYKATHDIRNMTSNKALLSRKRISACKNCGNPIYNTNRKFILIKNILDSMILIISIFIGINTDFKKNCSQLRYIEDKRRKKSLKMHYNLDGMWFKGKKNTLGIYGVTL